MRLIAFLLVVAASTAAAQDGGDIRSNIGKCWNLGALSLESLSVSVTVRFAADENGKLRPNTIRLVSWSGGPKVNADRVFDTARRAIVLCAGNALRPSAVETMRFDPVNGISFPPPPAVITDASARS